MAESEREIQVRSLSGESKTISISPNRTIQDLKLLLRQSTFLPAKTSPNFHLFFKGAKMSLASKINTYSMDDQNDFIVLVPFTKKTDQSQTQYPRPSIPSQSEEHDRLEEVFHRSLKDVTDKDIVLGDCLRDSSSGKCLLATIQRCSSDCICPPWLKKILNTFSFLNVFSGFLEMQGLNISRDRLVRAVKQRGLGIGFDDVEVLSVICPQIVKLDSYLTEIGQLGDAIVIVDSSTEEEEHFESANSLKTARKKASTSTVINKIKKREIAFKRCLSNSLRDLMGKRKSGNRIHVLLTLADLINASKNHGVVTNDGEVKRARVNGSFASCSRSKQRLCCDINPLLPSEMVEHLRKGIGSHGQIVHVEEISARPPVHVETPNELSENIRSALKRIGVSRLYSHQAESIQALLNGKSVVVATMTSSGKSLCYNIPVLEALSQDLFSCALYLFPTKALAQDQLRALSVMTEGMDIHIDMGLYDGDTPQEDRCHVRDNARLLITNPDMLHMSVLPFHTQFQRILSNLRFVVIDEAHAYKGAFGCHTALILRRLRRLCCHVYGRDPSFIFSTATSANPCEHAKELAGLSTLELIKNDGSPSSLKSFVMWNPPLNLKNGSKPSSGNDTSESAGTGVVNARRSSPISEVSRLFAEMVQHGLRCIAFCKTRKLCELVLANTREILQETAPNLVDSICVYRAGYTAQDRRRIEREFFGGKLSGVAATNALELGIDVGHIDTTLHLGFPGSISSLWQQAGRSGRRERPSLAVYVAFEGPVDQYFMKFPEKLFRSPIECCHIDAQNKQVLEQHLVCAALEHPLSLLYDEKYFGSGLESAIAGLTRKGYLSSDPSCDSLARIWSYIGHEKKPSYGISIRAIETEKYKVVDVKRNEVLEEIEESKAFFQVYEGAVYLHQGKTYLVKELDVIEKIALCQEADLKYYTKTRDYTDIHVLGEDMIYPENISETQHLRTTAHACTCKVTTTWFGFHRIWRGSNEIFDTVELSLPKYSYESQAVWVRVPQSIKAAVGTRELPFRSGLHAAAHALLNVVPLFIQCNSSDLGTECVNPHETRKFLERILLYDQHPGGSGIAAQVQPLFGVLLNAALDLLKTCSCYGETGCPNCIQVLSCREYNNVLDKSAAIIILQVSGKELRTTESANKTMSTSIDRKESSRCSGLGTCLCEFLR